MRKESKGSRKRIKGKIAQEMAVRLRIRGLSYTAMATEMGMSPSGAKAALKRAIDELNERSDDAVQEYRTVAGEQIDALVSGLWADATTGNADAARTVLLCLGRKAKLFGLDAPAKSEYTDQTAVDLMRIVSAKADERMRLAVTVESEPIAELNPPPLGNKEGSGEIPA